LSNLAVERSRADAFVGGHGYNELHDHSGDEGQARRECGSARSGRGRPGGAGDAVSTRRDRMHPGWTSGQMCRVWKALRASVRSDLVGFNACEASDAKLELSAARGGSLSAVRHAPLFGSNSYRRGEEERERVARRAHLVLSWFAVTIEADRAHAAPTSNWRQRAGTALRDARRPRR